MGEYYDTPPCVQCSLGVNMTRTRNFVFVLYPDSAPVNWVQLLDDFHIQACISPLHDQDHDHDGSSSLKKPHYHVLIMFDSVKTLDQARDIASSVGAANNFVFPVSSLRGYARYLCHLDNPDKAQYSPDFVVNLGGADYSTLISLASDKYQSIRDMMLFCIDHQIFSYASLLKYSSDNRDDWFRVLCDSGTLVMKEFLKSYKWSVENGQ